jgi:hypothetical protein
MPPRSVAGAALAAWLAGCGSGGAGARDAAADGGGGEIASWTAAPDWPMPNPAASGLPNPASYDTGAPGVVVDRVTGLAWQRDVGASTYVWADALAACAALSLDGTGSGAWRLPSLLELVSIVDFTQASPAVDPDAFPSTPADSFWTSTPVAGSAGDAWYVNFSTGFSYQGHQAFLPLLVRCVRTGAAVAARPGLTWQVAESDGIFTFDQAGQSCAELAGGAAGWRLPSMKELQSIVDVTRADPALDPAAFPGAGSFPLWTSSPLAGSTTDAWSVDFYLGAAATTDRGSTFRARCVR